MIESRQRLPAEEVWLLARRAIAKPSEIAYYFSNAAIDTTLLTLAHVASTRYTIEQCFEEAKDDVGLDHYEVRTWSSWYRYITLGMMALAWLVFARTKLPDEGSFPYAPALNPAPEPTAGSTAAEDAAAPESAAALAAPEGSVEPEPAVALAPLANLPAPEPAAALAAPEGSVEPELAAALAAPEGSVEPELAAALASPANLPAPEPAAILVASEGSTRPEPAAALVPPREKSPLPPKGAIARRRWLPGAFRKSAA